MGAWVRACVRACVRAAPGHVVYVGWRRVLWGNSSDIWRQALCAARPFGTGFRRRGHCQVAHTKLRSRPWVNERLLSKGIELYATTVTRISLQLNMRTYARVQARSCACTHAAAQLRLHAHACLCPGTCAHSQACKRARTHADARAGADDPPRQHDPFSQQVLHGNQVALPSGPLFLPLVLSGSPYFGPRATASSDH